MRGVDTATGDARPYVVHVSGDFPDPIEGAKTPVIRTLLDLTQADFRHRVVSLNRVRPSLTELVDSRAIVRRQVPFDYGDALEYAAPSRGLWHATMLRRLGNHIAQLLMADPPDLLVGHKLSIEGLAVAHAAQQLSVPYALSIQGNTDLKILAARPDLRGPLGKVFHQATTVFPFTPWARAAVENRLGKHGGLVSLLPCATDLDQALAPQMDGTGLISVFHLRGYRNKNLAGLAKGYRELRRGGSQTGLTIIGGGSVQDQLACRALLGERDDVVLAGAYSRAQLRQAMNQATGLVLPSFRESFGLVFIEALFAGLPIIYPKGTAVDGFLDGLPFAIPVNVHQPDELPAAMARLVQEERDLKNALRDWQGSDHARGFTRTAIAGTFRAGLHHALAASQSSGHSKI